ncbi:MAG: radical SAM protein [Thermodesulfobacteriota bacterium]|nr:radical SAM protein [Thermodesulfobacteriota bacterium]
MPDVLLIQPPVQDFYLTAKRTIPYGLACIGAALEKDGFSVRILDALAASASRTVSLPSEMDYLSEFYSEPDISPFGLFHGYKHFGLDMDAVAAAAARSGAFLIGISSLFTPYSDMALDTAEAVRKACSQSFIVAGGHHATAMPGHVMACPAIDFVIRGEAETAMPLLAGVLREHGTDCPDFLAAIPGIVFRKPDATLHISPPAVVENLNAMPLPAVHLVDQAFYTRRKRGSAVVTASRGCPLACSYCAVGNQTVPFRKRGIPSVAAEIEQAVTHYNAGFIDFEDENLTMDRAWFMELLNVVGPLARDREVELRAMNGLFPPSLDEAMVAAMKAAGFKTLNLSVGSFSSDQQRRFNRPDVGRAHDRAVSWCEKHGLEAVSYIIAGAPDQAPETTINDLVHLLGLPTLAGLSVFYPAPGSRDFEHAAEQGLLPAHLCLMRSSALPLSHATSRTDAVTLLRLSRIVNFIKALEKNHLPLPKPAPVTDERMAACETRIEKGVLLLAGFFHDAKIRGVTRTGRVYEHIVSMDLTRRFLEKIGEGVPAVLSGQAESHPENRTTLRTP